MEAKAEQKFECGRGLSACSDVVTNVTTPHHPVFTKFLPYVGRVPAGFQVDFLGTLTCLGYVDGAGSSSTDLATSYPSIDEEYFEWIDILESVSTAKTQYVMFELGAGYGRWAVRAACALRQKRTTIQCHLVAVEAEPQHFEWLRQHFCNNGLDPQAHTLIQGAVRGKSGKSLFLTGTPESCNFRADRWYGQAITGWFSAALYEGFRVLRPENGRRAIKVPSVTLQDLLKSFERVDLVDFDLQGEELTVIKSALDMIDHKVARLHIGTHTHEIERDLRSALRERGWSCLADYPCLSTSETPWGRINFQDGVQSWRNPRLVDAHTVDTLA